MKLNLTKGALEKKPGGGGGGTGRGFWLVKETHHFINLGGVELLNIPEDSDVVVAHKVDSHTLAPVSSRSADAVDVQLTRVGEIIIDDQGHLQSRTEESRL
jgi:hypothetical protein